mmetsp:Transcript_14693/g.31336  ORF Transcript_14693/g.31336 Transcript_14693/m.31336 type:complete len:102 (-) Transcript_14693:416-721(-)
MERLLNCPATSFVRLLFLNFQANTGTTLIMLSVPNPNKRETNDGFAVSVKKSQPKLIIFTMRNCFVVPSQFTDDISSEDNGWMRNRAGKKHRPSHEPRVRD